MKAFIFAQVFLALYPHTYSTPNVSVGGKAIIDYQLESFDPWSKSCNPDVGYPRELLIVMLKKFPQLNFHFYKSSLF
ncbi:MAG: hypothetical protein CM15mP4_0260 [Candidatus Neomarinimicrobiota bacterium]|nr:MAG: hypothetical protein CM15mP4_0260 [Candidatus Neomarinimicrobiota bacterium]